MGGDVHNLMEKRPFQCTSSHVVENLKRLTSVDVRMATAVRLLARDGSKYGRWIAIVLAARTAQHDSVVPTTEASHAVEAHRVSPQWLNDVPVRHPDPTLAIAAVPEDIVVRHVGTASETTVRVCVEEDLEMAVAVVV
jgi:hypothetical protein